MINIITFMTDNYKISSKRWNIDKNILLNKYEDIQSLSIFHQDDLPKKWFNRYEKYISDHGYAYWSWKPFLINKMLENLKPNTYIMYFDGGCDISKNYDQLYFNIKNAINTMMLNHTNITLTAPSFNGENIRICRNEILTKFNLLNNNLFLYKYPHYQAGIILIKVCNEIKNLISAWLNFFDENYESCIHFDYLDKNNQNEQFIHNGADQAIFQCLLYKNNIKITIDNAFLTYCTRIKR